MMDDGIAGLQRDGDLAGKIAGAVIDDSLRKSQDLRACVAAKALAV